MKRLNKIKALAIAAILAMAVAAPFALAQDSGSQDSPTVGRHGGKRAFGRHFGRGGHGDMGGFMLRGVDLTDAQKTQIQQIRASHKEAVAPLMQQIRAKEQAIHQSFGDDTFNSSLVNQQLIEIANLKTQLMSEQFKIHQETLAVLTPEQKTKLTEMREQFKAKREEMKAKRAERRANKTQQ